MSPNPSATLHGFQLCARQKSRHHLTKYGFLLTKLATRPIKSTGCNNRIYFVDVLSPSSETGTKGAEDFWSKSVSLKFQN